MSLAGLSEFMPVQRFQFQTASIRHEMLPMSAPEYTPLPEYVPVPRAPLPDDPREREVMWIESGDTLTYGEFLESYA